MREGTADWLVKSFVRYSSIGRYKKQAAKNE